MKKVLILILLLSYMLTGCSILDGEYHSVKPHAVEGNRLSNDLITVSNFDQLRDALVEMVSAGKQSSNIYISGFGLDVVDQYMSSAIMYVCNSSAVGAYAVDEITYEAGTSGGISAIAVDITYLHGRQEILRIKNASDMAAVKDILAIALNACETSVVIRVKDYKKQDLESYIRSYVEENPQLCMEQPQMSIGTYPDYGEERVLEFVFTYQTGREDLKMMQNSVSPIFSAARLYVQGGDSDAQKFEQLFAFLMERFDYVYETSITPAYSLLRYGVGDSKAFAVVYSAMCRNAGLECSVVSGTKDGEAYYWNLIRFDDVDYHLDLLACHEVEEFIPKVADEMTGYVWDYQAYS